MNTELVVAPEKQIVFGQKCLKQLKALVQRRPDNEKLIINGKHYLCFGDWQILGAFFGITVRVVDTEQITKEIKKPQGDGEIVFLGITGYKARAIAVQNGVEISSAEAMCLVEEKNWQGKPLFQILSMAQTRACAKALRNCLQWIVRLPTSDFAEEAAEEVANNKPKALF